MRPWADREPGKKELAPKGLPWRSEVARGEPCVREKPPGKLRCKGHFLASTRPVPSEAGFSGFGDRVRCAGCRARGWASCFLRIRGHRTSPPSLPHKHPFLVGEQSRCSLPRELGPPRERRRAPVLRLGRDFSFLIKRQNAKCEMFAETAGAFAVGKEKKGLGKSEPADTLQHSHAEESGALLADLEEGRRGS